MYLSQSKPQSTVSAVRMDATWNYWYGSEEKADAWGKFQENLDTVMVSLALSKYMMDLEGTMLFI